MYKNQKIISSFSQSPKGIKNYSTITGFNIDKLVFNTKEASTPEKAKNVSL